MAWDAWWENEISQEIAEEFLAECSEYTKKLLHKHTPELDERQFNHILQGRDAPFMPIGTVVHSTRSRTVWDAIRSIAHGVHGTHFVITNHAPPKGYELLSELPSVILMPMSPNEAVCGNGFLSGFTWSVDIRQTGKLRPYIHPFKNGQPSPVYFGEEGEEFFKYNGKDKPEFYWWNNLWRDKFNGLVRRWNNYFYEVPSFRQMSSLVALIRSLMALHPAYTMDKRLIVPSTCVEGGENPFPHINWELIRRLVFKDRISIEQSSFENAHPASLNDDEWKNNNRRDEAFIRMHINSHKWRTNPADDDARFLICGPNVEWRSEYRIETRNALIDLGYDGDDPDFAARMFTIAYHYRHINLNDVQTMAAKKAEQQKGF